MEKKGVIDSYNDDLDLGYITDNEKNQYIFRKIDLEDKLKENCFHQTVSFDIIESELSIKRAINILSSQ